VPVEINSAQWPVVFIKLDGLRTVADFEPWIHTFDELYTRKERFSIVTYLKSYASSPEVIGRMGRWWRETEPLIKQYWVSNAVVTSSAGVRFLMSAVYLVKPLPIPNRVCTSPDEAIGFTRAQWPRRLPSEISWPF
jgi:hypothetical protein